MADPNEYDFSALFAPPPTPQETLAEALRRKQALGQLGLMAGTPMGQRMGQALTQGVGQELQAQKTAAYEEAMRNAAESKARHDAYLAQQAESNAANASARTEKTRAETEKLKILAEKLRHPGPPKMDRTDKTIAYRKSMLQPRPGWEPIDPNAPTFRTPQQAASFDSAEAAFGALRNHRKHAAEALQRFKNAKSPAEADSALAEVNQQMANIASKLRVAEGLNNSDASNQAVETMLSLHNGSVATLRNFANEGRLDAILNSAINSARTNLDTMAASVNIRRKGGTDVPAPHEGTASTPAKTPTIMRLPDGTEVEVTD